MNSYLALVCWKMVSRKCVHGAEGESSWHDMAMPWRVEWFLGCGRVGLVITGRLWTRSGNSPLCPSSVLVHLFSEFLLACSEVGWGYGLEPVNVMGWQQCFTSLSDVSVCLSVCQNLRTWQYQRCKGSMLRLCLAFLTGCAYMSLKICTRCDGVNQRHGLQQRVQNNTVCYKYRNQTQTQHRCQLLMACWSCCCHFHTVILLVWCILTGV